MTMTVAPSRYADLTPKQAAIFDWIVEFINANQRPPTIRDICVAFGFLSPNAAHTHLKRLKLHGYLSLSKGVARGIMVRGEKMLGPVVGVRGGRVQVRNVKPSMTKDEAMALANAIIRAVLESGSDGAAAQGSASSDSEVAPVQTTAG